MARSALSGLPLLGVSLAALAGVALSPLPARALPQDGQVVAGAASIAQTGAASLAINQSSMAAIIDWQSFDIAANETVEVFQPSSMASLLNRVVGGGGASQILGALQAQGRLTLVNPAGVTIGNSARIDVAGLVASTANMSNQDFMMGRGDLTIAGRPGARIVNAGAISIRDGGLAALVAPGVENSGLITARLGRVQLAAGETFTLDLYGDDLIRIGVSDAMLGQIVNTGRISADGGVIEITARSGAAAVNSLINMGGVVEARSVGVENGTVVFYGASDGVVNVSGTVDVSGRNAGETGGVIKVLGDKVALTGDARLDASGDTGGGTILVGGDYQGQADTPTASRTLVTRDVTITADALTTGNADKVVVWADGDTRYYGSISARGGAQSGNGGTVEVSGKQNLGFDGKVDTSAPNGTGGSLLLDPEFIVIKNGAKGSAANDDDVTGGSIIFDAGGGTFFISEGALEALDGTIELSLQAIKGFTIEELTTDHMLTLNTNSVTFEIAGPNGFTMNAGDTIALTKSGAALTINAKATYASSTGTGDVSVGKITSTGAVTLTGNTITFNGASTVGSLAANADDGINVFDDIMGAGTSSLTVINGDIVFGPDITVTSSRMFLFGDGVSDGKIIAQGALSLIADEGAATPSLCICDDLQMNGDLTVNADSSGNGNGGLDYSTITANGFNINITASDIFLSGVIDATGAEVSITNTKGLVYVGGSNIATSGAMDINASELAGITAEKLIILNNDTINVPAVTPGDSDQIAVFVLGSNKQINFTGDSTFVALGAYADDGINIDAQLTITKGATLDADEENAGGGTLTVSAEGALSSTEGGFTLIADDIDLIGTINVKTGININQSQGERVALGNATEGAGMFLSDAELDQITTVVGARITTTGNMTVNNVSNASIFGGVLMEADKIFFEGAPSTFYGYTANAENGVTIDVNQTATVTGFIFDGDISDDSGGGISIAADVTLTANSGITLRAVEGGSGDIFANGNVSLLANNGVLIDDNFSAKGNVTINADADANGGATSAIGIRNNSTLSSTNNLITIIANGVFLTGDADHPTLGPITGDGYINAGSSSINFNAGFPGLDITLGGLDTDKNFIATSELQRITASLVNFETDGDITVSNVTNVSGLGEIALLGDTISFLGGASSFPILVASAYSGITVDSDLTSDGYMFLDGDIGASDSGGIIFADGVTLSARTGIFLYADDQMTSSTFGEGDLWAAGALTLVSNDDSGDGSASIGIYDTLHMGGVLSVNADFDGDGLGRFSIYESQALLTDGFDASITAGDLDIAGAISGGDVTITNTQNDIFIGGPGAEGSLNISNAELANITAGTLQIINSVGNITVNSIDATDSDGIVDVQLFNLDTPADNDIFFTGAAASVFRTLGAYSDGDIVVSANLTTTQGGLTLFRNNFGPAFATVTIGSGVAVTSQAGSITLKASDLLLDGSLTAFDAITIFSDTAVQLGGSLPDVTMHISADELTRMTADSLYINAIGDITVDGVTANFPLVQFTDQTIFSGSPSSFTGTLDLSADGGFHTLGADISVKDFQFDDAVLINGVRTITSTTGGTFSGTVDGLDSEHSLIVTTTTPDSSVLFNQAVGASHALHELTVTASIISLHDVTTMGKQTYGNGTVFFNSTYATGGFDFTVNGAVVANAASSINTGGGNITITGTASGAALTYNSGGGTVLVNGAPPVVSGTGTGTILIVGGSGAANDGEISDGQILLADFGVTGFVISEAALEALTGNLTLQAPVSITLADLTDNQLTLTGLSGAVNFTTSSGGTGFAMNAGDTILLDTTFYADTPNASTVLGGVSTTSDINLIARDVDFAGKLNAHSIFIVNSSGAVQIGNNLGVDMNISDAELGRITAFLLEIRTPGALTVDGVTAANTAGIDNLELRSDAPLFFSGDESSFAHSLRAYSAGALTVAANLTVNDGFAQFYADSDVNSTGSDNFFLASGKTITALARSIDIFGGDFQTEGGFLDAGSNSVTINGTTGSAHVGASGDAALIVSNAELANITAGNVFISAPGNMTVSGVTEGATAGKDIYLSAGILTFSGSPSVFDQFLYAETTSGSITLAQDITADGYFDFAGPVLVSGERTISSASGGRFQSTIDATGGGDSLTVASEHSVDFEGLIGASNPLDALSVTLAAGNINLGFGATTTGNQTYTGTTYLGGIFDLADGDFTVKGQTFLNGATQIDAHAGSVSMDAVNGSEVIHDFTVHGETGLSLGPLGSGSGGNPALQNVTLRAGTISGLTGDKPIGSAATPLFVNATTLTITASAATLDGAGLINGAAISQANVNFNGDGSGSSAALVIGPGGPVQWTFAEGGNGHYYDLVLFSGTWGAAREDAKNKTHAGQSGYLANITSSAEQNFIFSKFGGGSGDIWIGANDIAEEGEWVWADGPEAGQQFWQGLSDGHTTPPFNYANWNDNEPNDYGGNEDVGHIIRSNGAWNDLPVSDSRTFAYFVEYSDPTPGTITISNGASAPDDGQIADGKISFDDVKNASFTISGAALKNASTLDNMLILEAGHSITIQNLDDHTLTLDQAGGAVFSISGPGGFVMNAGDTIQLSKAGAALTIDAAATFAAATGSGDITLGTIASAGDVTLAGDAIAFMGAAASALKDLSVTAAGRIALASDLNVNRFDFYGPVDISGVRTIASTGGGKFHETVDGTGASHSLTVTASDFTSDPFKSEVKIDGAVGASHALHLLKIKAADIFLKNVTTDGDQIYDTMPNPMTTHLSGTYTLSSGSFMVAGTTMLDGATTISAASGAVTLGNVGGAFALNVSAPGGVTTGTLGPSTVLNNVTPPPPSGGGGGGGGGETTVPPVVVPPPPVVTSPPPPVVTPPPPPVVTSPPPPVVVPPPPVVTSPPPPVVTVPPVAPPPVVTPPPPPVVTPPPVTTVPPVAPPPVVETLPPPPPVAELPPPAPVVDVPPVVEPDAVAQLEQAVQSSVDISNQVDALTDDDTRADNQSGQDDPEEEAEQTAVIEDSMTNNAIVQVIQREDIGSAADPDDAPALSANCVCN